MTRIVLLIAILVQVASACFAQENPVIEQELQQLMKGGEEKIPVTIVLKSQIEPTALRARVAAHRDAVARRSAVVNEIKNHSDASQMPIMEFLQAEQLCGNVENISSLWISNSICCDAAREVIMQLAMRDDVAMIGLDKEQQMLCNTLEYVKQGVSGNVRASNMPHVVQVRAPEVWALGYTGKNIVVAILDSGINDEHLDIKDHLWQGYADTDGDGEADDVINGWNFSTRDAKGNANIKDDYGHGTHCAGIICGDGTSGNITGVAPDATLLTLKTIDRTGGGSPAKMIRGVQFAIENGADILSISSGFKSNQISTSDKEALRRAFEAVLEAGVIAFVAAGNDGKQSGDLKYVDIPAACPPPYLHPDQQANSGGLSSVVCVGAVNASDKYAEFSSQGPATWVDTEWNDYPLDDANDEHFGLIRPDICAPGSYIFSLKHDGVNIYAIMEGTSQATPCAAAIAALMLEKNGSLTPADICRIMEETAVKLSEKKSNLTGSGRVDALNAINAIEVSDGKPYVKIESFTPSEITQGEGRELRVTVTNYGNADCSENAVVALSTNDPLIAFTDNSLSLGSLAAGESRELVFPINVSADAANGHTVYIKVAVTDGALLWNDEIVFRVDSYAKILYNDAAPVVVGAGMGQTLDIEVVNRGNVATTGDTKLSLVTSSPYVTVAGDATVGVIAPGETATATFTVDVSGDVPDTERISFDLYSVPNSYALPENLAYSFELHTDSEGYIDDGFEGWTTFDASDDGRNHPWWHSSLSVKHRMESPGKAASGKGHLMSESYCSSALQDYQIPIDNYLVSPKIKATDGSRISFKARIYSLAYYGEHFGVAVSETGNKEASCFETIEEWTIEKADGSDWLEFSVDLSKYSGKEIYVAIRNFFTMEQWIELDYGYYVYTLHVDDVKFSNVIDMSNTFKYENYSYFWANVDLNAGTGVDEVEECGFSARLFDGLLAVAGVPAGSAVALCDVHGRVVASSCAGDDGCARIATAVLSKGVYLVIVAGNEGVTVKKVLVE